MLATSKLFTTLTAADLMSRDLVLIPQHMALRTAARVLSQAQVSGAPVIDGHGSCVGVISATDFLRRAREDGHDRRCECSATNICADWQLVETNALPTDTVATQMTRDPVLAPEGMHIGRLAQIMLDAHIHRVIVVGENNRPVGIVSSTDILAAVARFEDE
jgi:CBS domain-containing membrane protein